jgi:hypothetical protein
MVNVDLSPVHCWSCCHNAFSDQQKRINIGERKLLFVHYSIRCYTALYPSGLGDYCGGYIICRLYLKFY